MEAAADQLRERYEFPGTDELMDLHRNSDLSDLASSVLSEVLAFSD